MCILIPSVPADPCCGYTDEDFDIPGQRMSANMSAGGGGQNFDHSPPDYPPAPRESHMQSHVQHGGQGGDLASEEGGDAGRWGGGVRAWTGSLRRSEGGYHSIA